MSEPNIPPDSPWVHNALTGEKVPPALDFLINRLAILATPNTVHEVIVEVAKKILWIIDMIRAQRLEKAGRQQCSPRGHMKELEALRHSARIAEKTGDIEPLARTWATTSPEARSLVWKPNVSKEDVKRGKPTWPQLGDIIEIRTSDGAHIIAPLDPLLMIKNALKKPHRDKRVIDPLASELTDAIRDGYVAITGELPPGRIRRRDRSIQLQALARDIDQHFSLNLYLADGTHLRALRRIPKP